MNGIIDWFARNPVAGNSLMAAILFLGLVNWFNTRQEFFPDTAIDVITIQVPYPSGTPEDVQEVCVLIEEDIADLDGIERLSSVAAENIGVVSVEVEDGANIDTLMNDVRSRVGAINNFPENTEEPIIEKVLLRNQVMSLAISANTDEASLRRIAEQVRDDLKDYTPLPPATPAQQLNRITLNPRNGVIDFLNSSILKHFNQSIQKKELEEGINYQAGFGKWLAHTLGEETRITQIELNGEREYEISIEVSKATLNEYGLTFDEVANAVRAASLDLPGGAVRAPEGETLLRVTNRQYDAAGFADILVRRDANGATIRLSDIATIRDDFEEKHLQVTFNKRTAMLVDVFRVGDQSTIQIADLVKEWITYEAPSRLPEGVEINLWNDNSVYLSGRLDLLAKNGVIGLLLVTLVLALFLRPSLAFLVALGIPVAFAGAMLTLPLSGISINMISAFGFILVLGIVVDDAIVVGERVYSRIQAGEHPRLAAPRGTHEVGAIVIFGVTTTMVAFTPMLMVGGVSGKIWPNIPWVVIPTLAFSLVQSKLVLPGHLAMLKPRDPNRKAGWFTSLQRKIAAGLEWVANHAYAPILERALAWRYLTICLFIGLLVVTMSFVRSGRIPFAFLPDVEGEVISAKLEMAAGTSGEITAAAIAKLEQGALNLNEQFADLDGNLVVKNVLASSGIQIFEAGFTPTSSSGEYVGEVSLELSSASNRKITSKELISAWRSLVGPIPGVVELSFAENTGASGNAFDLELSAKDITVLNTASERIRNELNQYKGVQDITDSNRLGKREARIVLLPAAEPLGLTELEIASQVRQAFFGEEVQRMQRGRDEVEVYTRYPRIERESLAALENLLIRIPPTPENPNLREILFSEVAYYEYDRAYASIQRADQSLAVTVSADVDRSQEDAVDPNKMVADFENRILPELKKELPGLSWEFRGEQKDQADSIRDMMKGFVLAMLAIYILLAIPLKSYIQPFIVMSAIPFGLVGAVWGHMLLGLNFSIMSMCGIIALSGVVINDSLVLVDYVNRHRGAGEPVQQAARMSGRARFRAVVLTSLTTFIGLAPMITETDLQAKFLIPMAVALGFGILFATAIILVLVPSLYIVIEDIKRVLYKKEKREEMEENFRRAQQERDNDIPIEVYTPKPAKES